jgi:hypothetical protein
MTTAGESRIIANVSMAKSDDEPQNGDLALVLDRADSGDAYRVLRRRAADSAVELGTLRPMREGRPIDGEVVSLSPREDMPFVYDVKTELADPRGDRRPTSDGPPQIATDEYRRGWDAIWGTPGPDAAKPN